MAANAALWLTGLAGAEQPIPAIRGDDRRLERGGPLTKGVGPHGERLLLCCEALGCRAIGRKHPAQAFGRAERRGRRGGSFSRRLEGRTSGLRTGGKKGENQEPGPALSGKGRRPARRAG